MDKKKIFITGITLFFALSVISCSVQSDENSSQEEILYSETIEEGFSDAEDLNTEESGDLPLQTKQDVSLGISDDIVTIFVYDPGSSVQGAQTGWFAQVLLDEFHVVLEYISDPNEADLLLFGLEADYLEALDAGVLLDWNKEDLLLNYGDCIAAYLDAALIWDEEAVYGIAAGAATSVSDKSPLSYTFDLRWDLYAQLGYPLIEDLDDLMEVLHRMQEICPADDKGEMTYGISLCKDEEGGMISQAAQMVSAYYGYDSFGIGFYDPTTQQFYGALLEDGPYLEMLAFFNMLYQEGLLDPVSKTQGEEELAGAYQSGRAFFNVSSAWGSELYNTTEHLLEGKAMFACPPAEALPIAYGISLYGEEGIFSINANTSYPELCMTLLNWLASPDGKMTTLYGPKEICWYYDEEGYTHLTAVGEEVLWDASSELEGYTGSFGDGGCGLSLSVYSDYASNPESNGETFYFTSWESMEAFISYEIERDYYEYTGHSSQDAYACENGYVLAMATSYEEGEPSKELSGAMDASMLLIQEYSWDAIFASSDEEFNDAIFAMQEVCLESGYEESVAYWEEEAKKRAACEDELIEIRTNKN